MFVLLGSLIWVVVHTGPTPRFHLKKRYLTKTHLSVPASPSCSSLSCLQSTAHLAMYPLYLYPLYSSMYPLSLITSLSSVSLFHWAIATGRWTGSKLSTFSITLVLTGNVPHCPLLRLFNCCPEEEDGLSLSLTVSNCRLWQKAVSIQAPPPSPVRSCPADLKRQTEAGVTAPPSKPPQATKPPTQNQSHALLSDTDMKLRTFG